MDDSVVASDFGARLYQFAQTFPGLIDCSYKKYQPTLEKINQVGCKKLKIQKKMLPQVSLSNPAHSID